jgi:hypothetical protein
MSKEKKIPTTSKQLAAGNINFPLTKVKPEYYCELSDSELEVVAGGTGPLTSVTGTDQTHSSLPLPKLLSADKC